MKPYDTFTPLDTECIMGNVDHFDTNICTFNLTMLELDFLAEIFVLPKERFETTLLVHCSIDSLSKMGNYLARSDSSYYRIR